VFSVPLCFNGFGIALLLRRNTLKHRGTGDTEENGGEQSISRKRLPIWAGIGTDKLHFVVTALSTFHRALAGLLIEPVLG